ncbi:hypothetical protein CPB83DRAFT_843909 [Crepidotus variabilis]|uniref:J domain-containing protein n=1 Tax=Crepidotus variabilis TaxID=179855 RepID=A0A9P6ESX6_9AGAR|nr:hypothetical protein CPB83DRAFT_843909 [Crepidotus variabilis]
MRFTSVSYFLTLLVLFATSVLAWEKEDHEIFDLVTSLEDAEGKGTTFYSFLDVPSTATTQEIAKAYRKKSMVLHPDKNPGVKGIHERFSRLGVISTILRNKESRERYDFFYKNGVPVWRGTGYYYSRFRPGVGTVLVFLTLLTSGLQYLVQNINYKKDLKRIEVIIQRARSAAWGPKLVPITGTRKVRVGLGDSVDSDGEYVGSKFVDMVVDEQHVYLLEGGERHLIDASTAIKPAFLNTWFFALVKASFHKATGSKFVAGNSDSKKDDEVNGDLPEVDSEGDASSDGASKSGYSTPKDGENGNVKRVATSKAGGARRKNVKRR